MTVRSVKPGAGGQAAPGSARKLARRAGLYLALIAGGLAMMIPFFWMLTTSLKTRAEVFSTSPLSFPSGLHWENYTKMWFALPGVTFGTFFQNSIVIASLATLGQLITCSMAAYAFAVFDFRFKRVLFARDPGDPHHPVPDRPRPQLHPLPVPPVPPERERQLDRDEPAALGLGVLRRGLRHVPPAPVLPDDPERAGGRGPRRRGQPVADLPEGLRPARRPALATLAIFQFMWSWNDLLDPLIYLRDLPTYTTTVGLAFFQGQYVGKWPEMMAGALVSLLPMVILFLVAQKYFVRGITLSGLKG